MGQKTVLKYIIKFGVFTNGGLQPEIKEDYFPKSFQNSDYKSFAIP